MMWSDSVVVVALEKWKQERWHDGETRGQAESAPATSTTADDLLLWNICRFSNRRILFRRSAAGTCGRESVHRTTTGSIRHRFSPPERCLDLTRQRA